jgi:hypothetical protein
MNCHPSHQLRCGLLQTIGISSQPSPAGDGVRWAGREPFQSRSPRTHLLETPSECLDATNAAIVVRVFQSAQSVPPLLGERAGVRADQPSESLDHREDQSLTPFLRPHRPRVIRQRMRRPFLKFPKDGIANHLRRASQSRIPEPELLDAKSRKIVRPLFVMLTLLGKTMLGAIQFNREASLFAEKVQGVSASRMLSAKLISTEPTGAQPAPKNFLSPSGVLAKCSGCVGGHGLSVGRCVEVRKNRVMRTALTPTLSPRRGGAADDSQIIRRSFSAFVSFGKLCGTFAGVGRGDQSLSLQRRFIRVPSPGGEGQGEGGTILTSHELL